MTCIFEQKYYCTATATATTQHLLEEPPNSLLTHMLSNAMPPLFCSTVPNAGQIIKAFPFRELKDENQ
ncbi:hypothetical protein GDO81_000630 [Engystomops pustulosus]|uniref:Uncharacterized protein n=1 Tax=Engystomops pustulosus TaxID=76066 RepID=A0AAV7D7I3_ENGPU|nr:hypothetical protein GDO81_000630 [Engystomops pustulosus]